LEWLKRGIGGEYNQRGKKVRKDAIGKTKIKVWNMECTQGLSIMEM
jgi:hypothetical protein